LQRKTKIGGNMSLRIKELIKEKGLSVQELADRMGISRVGLSQHINGNPSVEVIGRIAEALGVEMYELFKSKSEIVEEITEETRNTIRCPKCGARFVLDEKEE
jgi:transcriptional regulator with XRE-family HTH domain